MFDFMKMFSRMSIGGTVATANVAAGQAKTQVYPAHAGFQALLTPRRAGGNRFESQLMFTNHRAPLRKQ